MSIPTINLKVIVPSLFTIALLRMVINKLSSHFGTKKVLPAVFTVSNHCFQYV